MQAPTDTEIFNHMLPEDDYSCVKCGSDNVEEINYGRFITYKCNCCGYEPSEPEED